MERTIEARDDESTGSTLPCMQPLRGDRWLPNRLLTVAN
jgi:hypothetical protein